MNKLNKTKVIRMLKTIVLMIACLLLLYLIVQRVRCGFAVKNARSRLEIYDAQTARLSYGNMTYVDQGSGDTILSIHGIFGGYDQAFDTCKDKVDTYRIIAPSRFGYLGSDVLGNGTPAEQATAYVELLDNLGVDKVYLLATSAGGTVAIRFALDYPERTEGLILYCSAPPLIQKPDTYLKYQGPPAFLCNNYAMFLISPLFEPIMGMESSTIYSMLPINMRNIGVEIDASITNPDMAKNYVKYPIEELQVPTLILHAKDDKMSNYYDMKKAAVRFPNCTFVTFETGGHLMTGHSEEIDKTLYNFIEK